jgi:hypothetical protein
VAQQKNGFYFRSRSGKWKLEPNTKWLDASQKNYFRPEWMRENLLA